MRGGKSQSMKCVCCSSGSQTCLLEAQISQVRNLTQEERVKRLIHADHALLHFSPIDTKKGPSSRALAGGDGRLKDDIWHECCACCSQFRSTILHEMRGYASELCREQLCSKFIQVQLSRCLTTEK